MNEFDSQSLVMIGKWSMFKEDKFVDTIDYLFCTSEEIKKSLFIVKRSIVIYLSSTVENILSILFQTLNPKFWLQNCQFKY